MLYVTRVERFNAAHRLFNKNWDDIKNNEVFRKCSNPNWHGHNYEITVTVKGNINPDTGFVINMKTLSSIIKEKIITKIDHSNLNIDVDFIKDIITSSENICVKIWEELEEDINKTGAKLHSIKLKETEKNIVEYFGN